MVKYAIPEIERRWVALKELLPNLGSLHFCTIQDNYITDTRLRLRKETQDNGKIVYKLCKKYGKTGPITEEIVNSYLTEDEYKILLQLPSLVLHKTRYFDNLCDINIFKNGIITIEKEFKSEEEAKQFIPPLYCGEEVSDDKKRDSATIVSKE